MPAPHRWIDLAAHGVYVGTQTMADGKARLIVLDLDDRGDPAQLGALGLQPVTGSPRYDKGIYYLRRDEQRLPAKALAAAFGITECPVIEADAAAIDKVFREKLAQKMAANLTAVMKRSRPLGHNPAGQLVYASPSGRFIHLADDRIVVEGSRPAAGLGRPAFLRADSDEELRDCADGFLWSIRQGEKKAWPDLLRFGRAVYGLQADAEPSDIQMHRVQEALEAAANRQFSANASQPDQSAFQLAQDLYYGLPAARMRTAESVLLQQYSTPLPLSVVAQRLLIGHDDTAGKSVLEPSAGNGGLVNLLAPAMRIYAVELDPRRLEALRELGRIDATLGDATAINFQQRFGLEQGFDYTIANPPFGSMDRPKAFDRLPQVRRLDHYIVLRALAARKEQGRSVAIIGADSAQSDGAVKGGARAFLNYLYDHYEVHGLVEVDGRLYSRVGAGYNVRLLVIGAKRDQRREAVAPDTAPIITDYEQLWRWSSHLIERYPAPAATLNLAATSGERQDAPPSRRINEFQAPYQSASKVGDATTMAPINMAGAIYAALNSLEVQFGPIDAYVADKLRYPEAELARYFSPEQIDAIGLAIKAVEDGRGIINADQTGIGKGRWVAAMLRYAKLNGYTPVFLTIKPELFTDIFRDIDDIGSRHLFDKLFIFNEGESVKQYGTEDTVLYRATTPQERKTALAAGGLEPDIDLVMATYSQFMRAYHQNPKARLLTEIAANRGMLILDEAHVASGASNLAATVGQAVANSAAVLYASATPLKGVNNFAIYHKVFPPSVDLKTLPATLKAGGEALQEAISTNMALDGVLIRREHDYSMLTFHTRHPADDRRERNIALANELAEILAGMSYLAGDVSRLVAEMNKDFKRVWDAIPERDRQGARMQASSLNFGSRLYSLNRQFLLGIKIEDAIEAALDALAQGRKPVIAVENTGESLLRQVIARRAGIEPLELELDELNEQAGALSAEQQARRDQLIATIASALRAVALEEPPQYRELLESMLDRIGVITVRGRYGERERINPDSLEYAAAAERLREQIQAFPDLPLTPIDLVKKELQRRGYPVAEVSGRTVSITPAAANPAQWDVSFHPKADAVANVAGFQNGKYDAIFITRSGSTGISLHATDRFEDSDIRQREFIVLQKASNIAEFLQWLGRVNRKDQVTPPLITVLESGLPAESRLTMMHNAKLRKLSANTTSNRQNANLEGEAFDLLNDVGDRVALDWLVENPDMADYLDIALPSEDETEDGRRWAQECPYINKLLGRLLMVSVDRQQDILSTLSERFADKLEELEQRGENPFKVDVYAWGATVVEQEELQSGVIRSTGSTFDDPVTLATVRYEQDIYPIRSEKLMAMIRDGLALYRASGGDAKTSPRAWRDELTRLAPEWIRRQLPATVRASDEPLATLLERKDVAGAQNAKARVDWLARNLDAFRPGVRLTYVDAFKGERTGIITSVEFPKNPDDRFLLSKYRARVVFPGEDKSKEITLATVRTQEQDLISGAWLRLDPDERETGQAPGLRQQAEKLLAEFDEAPMGKVSRTQYVLQGNIFRACELAHEQRLGAPMLFTDKDGNRQRAVLIKDRITPDMVKALPVGMDARDMSEYIDECLRPDRPDPGSRASHGALRIYDAGVKDMKPGEGVMLEALSDGCLVRLTIPGAKSKAGRLMADGAIFDIGQQTPEGSLRLKLSGTRTSMQAIVDRSMLPRLLHLLQQNHHVGKFYVPTPDQGVIKTLKERHAPDHARSPAALDAPTP